VISDVLTLLSGLEMRVLNVILLLTQMWKQ